MDAGPAARLLRWLEGDAADTMDAAVLARVRASSRDLVSVGRHGSLVCYADAARRRRVLEFDRHGTLLAALRWHDTALAEARVRLADRSWLRIEPRAATDAPWGSSDRLWHADTVTACGRALTLVEALDWLNVDRIPTLAEPARLPAGAGTTVLNLIASAALDQGRTSLRYAGAYPTEQLFATLLESFRYEPTGGDPIAAFTRGELRWRPAPHERLITPEGACVHARARVEKVVWRSHAYHRPDAQGIGRHAPYRLRDVGERVVCSLWALGTAVEDTLELTHDGEVARIVDSSSPPPERGVMPAEVADGIGAIVATTSAPALAPAIRAAARRLTLEWAPLRGELAAVRGDRVQVSNRLRALLAESLRSPTDEARHGAALATVTEIALLLGDALRARAQAQVATLPEHQQRALLETPPLPDPDTPRAIAAAMAALTAAVGG